MLTLARRTYGDNEGEDIREGFEPSGSGPNPDGNEFVVGEDDGESPVGEEAREWNEEREPTVTLKPKYGMVGEDLENVWGGDGSSEPPKENP